ncbi:single-stranded-DNA-specific exonuclease RecJ [Acidithiobacillus thiooxidans]|uniref:single-stranded-DNA-specific exonuclease RecJ n=1 Tax=Acidithiobacillus thiooxidans TaxID=930 RepID=UPI001C06818A|nr:single-stranded-DNA-specific exonuclease RecJ [Acidithiobacillus thiooxidans]MBU2792786.1 single-stranded-DNA-specific exonuclease RecJ [Acidithiobacillus thiooxidans]
MAFGLRNPSENIESEEAADTSPSCDSTLSASEAVAHFMERLYAARGGDFALERETFADIREGIRRLEKPVGPLGLLGILPAVHLLQDALTTKTPIAVVGDFDVDGVNATTILVRALSPFTEVTPIIPDRKTEGYGLSPVLAQRIPLWAGLVITVDNGISALEGARVLRERGQKLLITDHHLSGDILPEADAIVNPNQPGCPFPWKSTCGAGVAWYLLWALQGVYPEWKGRMPIRDLLSLVAVATVADVVPLEQNNRMLVRIGLNIIRQGLGPIGLQALFRVAGKDPTQATSSDCGFIVGPRLNAVGRMANMMTGLELLLTEEDATAQTLARELDATNRERRAVESSSMVEAVDRALLSLPSDMEGNPATHRELLVLSDTTWHEGIVGLMAGRLRERFGVPVFVFTRAQEGGWKGSGRSIPGFHLRDALAWVDAQYPGCIGRFGGHAMAAGLTLPDDQMDTFRNAIQQYPGWLSLRDGPLKVSMETDGALPASLLNVQTAAVLRDAGPWGAGFAEPVFEGVFRVVESTVMKGGHWRLQLSPQSGKAFLEDVTVTAVRFLRDTQGVEVVIPAENDVLAIRYTLQVNRWRDRDGLQMLIQGVDLLTVND